MNDHEARMSYFCWGVIVGAGIVAWAWALHSW
jgi:3-dehydroquinate dehydratase